MSDPRGGGPGNEELHHKIRLLIQNLSSIRDETGEFLQHLSDGRIVDTKSWDTNTWDWTHGLVYMAYGGNFS